RRHRHRPRHRRAGGAVGHQVGAGRPRRGRRGLEQGAQVTQAVPALAGRTPRSGPRGLHWRARATPYLFLAPALVAVGAFVGYPIVSVAAQSFFDINPTKHEGWDFVGLQNYAEAFADSAVWGVLGNSLAWTIGSVALQLVIAMAGALLVQQLAGARILRAIFVIPWATPVVVGALAWKLLYQ